jgi:hypothetical protein
MPWGWNGEALVGKMDSRRSGRHPGGGNMPVVGLRANIYSQL